MPEYTVWLTFEEQMALISKLLRDGRAPPSSGFESWVVGHTFYASAIHEQKPYYSKILFVGPYGEGM